MYKMENMYCVRISTEQEQSTPRVYISGERKTSIIPLY